VFLLAALLSAGHALGQEGLSGQIEPRTEDLRMPLAPTCAPMEAATGQSATGRSRVAWTLRFLGGGITGLAIHESGHIAAATIFDASPGLKRVTYGPFPFFAISHRTGLSPRREFAVSSAGFWFQHIGSEILLSAAPDLRRRNAPWLKGVLAFDVLTSLGYAATAVAKAGPPERDTRAMAEFLGVDEGWVGAMVAVPALLDTWRYAQPGSRTAAWSSRIVKGAMVLLVARQVSGR
jgi:hypothetical protein